MHSLYPKRCGPVVPSPTSPLSPRNRPCTRRTLPILLKLKDENEDVWVKKMAAMQELMEAWQKKKDKDNWVLPRVEIETRGGWKGWKREDDAGLGEGLGRLRCEELIVDEVTF
jgi:hypothetical protein